MCSFLGAAEGVPDKCRVVKETLKKPLFIEIVSL
jgi:hypothetical protein